MKRPKTIILLLVIYVYSFLRGLHRTLLFTSNPDYYLFTQTGLSSLFFILSIPILILTGLTLWFLWKPQLIGFWIAITGLGLEIISAVAGFVITSSNPEITKQAYILYREARELPVRQEALDTMMSPVGIWVTFGIVIGLNLFIGALFVWKKYYFSQERSDLNPNVV